jgi:signal transduction histidine kinase
MWVTIGVSIYFSRETALANLESNAGNLTLAFDNEVTHTLSEVGQTMELVADHMRAFPSDRNIYKLSQTIPIVTNATNDGGIIAPNGKLVSATLTPDIVPIDVSDRDYFRIQIDGKFEGRYIGKPVMGRISHELMIPISERVTAKDGRWLGVLVFFLSPLQLTKLYNSMDLGQHDSLSIIGFDNVVRARFSRLDPEGFDHIVRTTEHDFSADAGASNEHGSFTHQGSVDHMMRFYNYRQVDGYPLYVVVGLDYNAYLTEWRTQAIAVIGFTAITTLLLGGLAFYLVRELSRRTIRDAELKDERSKLLTANTDLIGERQKLQAANGALLKSKEHAEMANQAKSSFLANMSHELRTPLNAIIGFSEVIKDQIMGPIGKPIYADYAKDIWGAGERLLEIINNLLDLSKMEADKTELRDEVLDPAEIMNASLTAMRFQAANKKITLTADIPPGMPLIRGDSLRLRQVLINLISNAVKFTEAGHVTVSIACDAAQGFRFTVADTGIGMSPAEIVVALEPFGQIETAYSKKNEGTGLGLPLAQRLVELHGGRLEIESVKGVGTTVSVYLPLDRVIRSVPEVAA